MALAAVGHSNYWADAGGGPGPPAGLALQWVYASPWLRVLFFTILLRSYL